MITLRAELHVHTALSPCAEVEMIPPLIVQEALDRGIELIAITDHNTCANAEAVMKASVGSGLVVLPGIELQTREEVHSLCLFDTLEQAQALETWIRPLLPPIQNQPEHFGEQFVVDETGDFIRREDQLLLVSAQCSIEEAFAYVTELGGLFIPAHVNRPAFGLLANLGMVPSHLNFPALEISRHLMPDSAVKKFPQIAGYPLIRSGDAHRLDEMLGANQFVVAHRNLQELYMALRQESGRFVTILSEPNR